MPTPHDAGRCDIPLTTTPDADSAAHAESTVDVRRSGDPLTGPASGPGDDRRRHVADDDHRHAVEVAGAYRSP
jgi:hypothetical protein